ncbi:RusA family crossover junction endodeoxyribonuclease [Brevundimonas sp. SL161]|uniref:RusA family crossover junction endodeoxyribonuclease n=1 Tax=Brevundimonas sp. SL161 TaxID=2804613 RepID=UPI003CF102A9
MPDHPSENRSDHAWGGARSATERTKLCFTVPGPAKAKGRGRVHRVGNNVHVYPDQVTVLYENWVKLHAMEAWNGRDLMEGPIAVSIDVVYEPVPTKSKKERTAMLAGL